VCSTHRPSATQVLGIRSICRQLQTCSAGVEHALLDLMRMGSSAGPAQQAVVAGLVKAMHGVLHRLPAQESGTLPTAAQVPCPPRMSRAL
jgi:hypothetical protein